MSNLFFPTPWPDCTNSLPVVFEVLWFAECNIPLNTISGRLVFRSFKKASVNRIFCSIADEVQASPEITLVIRAYETYPRRSVTNSQSNQAIRIARVYICIHICLFFLIRFSPLYVSRFGLAAERRRAEQEGGGAGFSYQYGLWIVFPLSFSSAVSFRTLSL